jgi:hypothetical protein
MSVYIFLIIQDEYILSPSPKFENEAECSCKLNVIPLSRNCAADTIFMAFVGGLSYTYTGATKETTPGREIGTR